MQEFDSPSAAFREAREGDRRGSGGGNFPARWQREGLPLAAVLLCALFPPMTMSGAVAELGLNVSGAMLMITGAGMRAAVLGYTLRRCRAASDQKQVHGLMGAGLFGVVRNPLRLGHVLMYGGLFVVHNSFWTYILGGIIFLPAYQVMALAEEHALTAKFGQHYANYCREVQRWWPRLSRLPIALAGMEFNASRALRQDYGTLCAGCLGLLCLLGIEAVQTSGWAGAQERLAILVAAAVLVLALTVAAHRARGSV